MAARKKRKRRDGPLGDTPYEHLQYAAFLYRRRHRGYVSCDPDAGSRSLIPVLREATALLVHARLSGKPKLEAMAGRHMKSVEASVRACLKGSTGPR
jgi:hypothetical protein